MSARQLADPVIPEPPRLGEEGGAPCPACADDPALGRLTVWSNDRWRLHALRDFPLAGTCLLEPRRHVDGLVDLDGQELAELGPLSARISRALYARGDVGRVLVSTFGDGLAHLHVWHIPRPLGALELRGSMLFAWLDELPRPSTEEMTAAAQDLGRRLEDLD